MSKYVINKAIFRKAQALVEEALESEKEEDSICYFKQIDKDVFASCQNGLEQIEMFSLYRDCPITVKVNKVVEDIKNVQWYKLKKIKEEKVKDKTVSMTFEMESAL